MKMEILPNELNRRCPPIHDQIIIPSTVFRSPSVRIQPRPVGRFRYRLFRWPDLLSSAPFAPKGGQRPATPCQVPRAPRPVYLPVAWASL